MCFLDEPCQACGMPKCAHVTLTNCRQHHMILSSRPPKYNQHAQQTATVWQSGSQCAMLDPTNEQFHRALLSQRESNECVASMLFMTLCQCMHTATLEELNAPQPAPVKMLCITMAWKYGRRALKSLPALNVQVTRWLENGRTAPGPALHGSPCRQNLS